MSIFIKGGIKSNVIPDECRISIDRRLIPEENLEEAEKELLETINSVLGIKWEMGNVFRIPTVPPCEVPMIDKLGRIIKEVTGQTGKYGEMGSGDLSAIVYREWGAKDFGVGAIRPECNIHGKDEFVYQKDIVDLGEIVARFLKE